jgi:hypothetical protein
MGNGTSASSQRADSPKKTIRDSGSGKGISRSLDGMKRSMHVVAQRLSGLNRLDQVQEQPKLLKGILKKPSSTEQPTLASSPVESLVVAESFIDDEEPAYWYSVGDIGSGAIVPLNLLKNKKSVMFDQVFVREYTATYCHNPCVKDGLAVALGWEYRVLDPQSMDDFEKARPIPKTSREGMFLDYMARVKIVRAGGASMKEIRKAMEITRKARASRMVTLRKVREEDYLHFEMAEEHRKLQLRKRCVEEFNGNVCD